MYFKIAKTTYFEIIRFDRAFIQKARLISHKSKNRFRYTKESANRTELILESVFRFLIQEARTVPYEKLNRFSFSSKSANRAVRKIKSVFRFLLKL